MGKEHFIAEQFELGESISSITPYGNGNINDTYLVTLNGGTGGTERRVILQRLNPRVFPQPVRIMANLRTALDHIERRPPTNPSETHRLRFPAIHASKDGQDFVVDFEGRHWRAMDFVDNTRSFDYITDARQAAEAGFALGRFHALLHDLDPKRLYDTLPGFHVTPGYLRQFEKVAATLTNSTPTLAWCLAFVEARRPLADALEGPRNRGQLPSRTVHGDPKLSNFLFDIDSGLAVSLIDLDTVKPGLIHYDIGDCLRSCCNPAGEDPDLPEQADFDFDIFRATLERYLEQAGGFLLPVDYALLYPAIRLLPFELGLRFLTDHLEGDRYFKVDETGQNLRRALAQFHLTMRIEACERHIRKLIRALTPD